ncbi:hypothetical protein [Legionella sp. PC997]|uniref:hypothetical protein n=1 Tax=Legionella sp. PC997 TaxID=2755562 RepID=UPI0015FB468E|nr:hypothetical protein [Legionella sp. PC997]QMT60678.1 hypothetical protein HBNCFIEN_02062 [Legionella sp. PC997]
MASSKRFFINSSQVKMINVYESLHKEFKKDMSHIESAYNEILNDKKINGVLVKEKEELQNKINTLLTNFTCAFIKDNQGLLKDIYQLKINILQLKTKFMIQHILSNSFEFDLEDYLLVVNLHNSLEQFRNDLRSLKWTEAESDTSFNSKYFDQVHSLVREQYNKLAAAFSIGDPWENWSYDEEEDSDLEDSKLELN